LATITLCAATPDSTAFVQLQQQVGKLQTELKNQKNDFSKQIKNLQTEVAQCKDDARNVSQNIAVLADSLGVKISETATNADSKIVNIETAQATSLKNGIIGGAVLLLLSVALFLWLYFKRKSDSASIVKQLEEQKSSIEQRVVKEYSVQTEVLENLMKIIRKLPITPANGGEPDHSLALKLADEITLMERNISLMDNQTKGLKQLTRSIGKLKDNLAATGYEIPELLGKPYNTGLKAIITNTIQDESVEKGVELITKIVKPQVNYQDKMIQAAQIEVSIN
jgi:hypothetical protein